MVATVVRYAGSPVSKGVFQPDMWGVTPTDRWNWAELRAEVAEHGVRNSLLVAPMPTASTAQILGNNESFEPYTSNMYNRRVLSGEFTIVNRYLLADLDKLGLWPKVKNQLIAHNGSVQRIAGIPVRAPHQLPRSFLCRASPRKLSRASLPSSLAVFEMSN